MPSKLEKRQHAVEATLKRFGDKPFELGDKGSDCMQVFLFLCHKLKIKLPGLRKLGHYHDAITARQALRRAWDVKNVIEFADKFFDRIPVAACLPGDLIAAPEYGDTALGGLMIFVGNDLTFLFDEEHDKPVIGRLSFEEGKEPIAAWRVLP
jgi:hypothetical protein